MLYPPSARRSLGAILLLGACGLSPLTAVRGQDGAVSYAPRDVAGVPAHVIVADLNDPSVQVSLELARGFPHGAEPFESMVRRTGAVAAVDGAFFSKGDLKPIGDIVIDGRKRLNGRMGTVMAITADNRVDMLRVPWGRTMDWSGYRTVLGCGPTLVRSGDIDLRVRAERFRDPHVLGSGSRTAVGVTPGGKLVLVSVTRGVTLGRLAQMMQSLGCVNAMNLDGGASTAMYYRGRSVVPAGRHLTNVLLISQGGRSFARREAR